MGMEILLYVAGFAGLLLVLRFLGKSLRFLLRVGISTLLGGALLTVLNTFGTAWHIGIAVNPLTAFLAGILGLPGVAALLFIQLWL